MDPRFTKQLNNFLSQEESSRDYHQGAILLLQLSGNKFMYQNISVNPAKYSNFINRSLEKYNNVRQQALTHEQVMKMETQCRVIEKDHISEESEFKKGKRADHDALPIEVQSFYTENLNILRRMRDVQTQLRMLSTDGRTCPDNDRFPYLEELIKLDKRYHSNWEKYDTYVGNIGAGSVKQNTDMRADNKKYQRLVSLNMGKYRKKPTEPLKIQIKNWFSKIVNPPSKMVNDLRQLSIVE